MNFEIEKICRTCLGTEGPLLSLYDNQGSGSVADMLGELTDIRPEYADGMPEKVCISCISEINRCYTFKLKCNNSERTLRQLLTIGTERPQNNAKSDPNVGNKSVSAERKHATRKETINGRNLRSKTDTLEQGKSGAIYSLRAEEDLTSFFVISAMDDDENSTEDGKQQGDENKSNLDFNEIIPKLSKHDEDDEDDEHHNDDSMSNDPKSDFGYPASMTKMKDELKCVLCPMTFVHLKNLDKHMGKHHNIYNLSNQPETEEKGAETRHESSQVHSDHEYFQLEFQAIDDNDDSNAADDPPVVNESTEVQSQKQRCPRCGAGFALQKSLNIHIKQNKCTEKQYCCAKCQKVFISQANLHTHFLTHREKLACGICTESFNSKDELNEHNKDVHNVKLKNQCPMCKKVFTMLSTLKDHMRIHSGEKPFLCSVCGKGFSQNANLKQHVMRHTKTKPFKCAECPRSFVSKGELFSHLRSHTGDHPFSCDICSTAFTTSSSLVKHKRIHTGERPYACEFCPMRFTALNTLKNHRRTHTGEKPYKCKHCDRGFAQKSDCAIHMRTHGDDRQYVCQICGGSFVQISTLRTHMKIHKKGKSESQYSQSEVVNEEIIGNDEEVLKVDEGMSPAQEHDETDEQKGSASDEANELGEEELLTYAMEECSSENNNSEE